ncbi:MAG: nucleotide exchange factor GrpE [Rickettsiales bacterium]|jgi:molecular chaperone GrpE|nr:nucleotide exchange factor GrpE [Rickettsiales bacterium]
MTKEKEILNESAELPETEAVESTPAETVIAELQNQLAELNDKYLRTLAELENTRRRGALDASSAARARAVSTAENFLPLIDAIGAAGVHSPDDAGIAALAAAAGGVLSKVGITKIESVGQTLNPQFHNAIQLEESASAAAGTITQELQTGYMFGDTVLRPAMVVVAK